MVDPSFLKGFAVSQLPRRSVGGGKWHLDRRMAFVWLMHSRGSGFIGYAMKSAIRDCGNLSSDHLLGLKRASLACADAQLPKLPGGPP